MPSPWRFLQPTIPVLVVSLHAKPPCDLHHVTVDGDKRRLMVASLRYLDTFAKIDGAWLFAERLLYVDWLEQRALS
jgi:hypothetical protein